MSSWVHGRHVIESSLIRWNSLCIKSNCLGIRCLCESCFANQNSPGLLCFFRCSSFTSSGKGNEKWYTASAVRLSGHQHCSRPYQQVGLCRQAWEGVTSTKSFFHCDFSRVSTTWHLCSLNGRVRKVRRQWTGQKAQMRGLQAELGPCSLRAVCTLLEYSGPAKAGPGQGKAVAWTPC